MNTVQELDFSRKALPERWSRVTQDFWGDIQTHTVRAVKRLLETSMMIEQQDLLGATHWNHQRRFAGHRNGFYRRTLLTSNGFIPDLQVPRLRQGRLSFKCLAAYARRSPDVDQVVLDMFLAGVSTRRVHEVLAPLLGPQSLSSSTVSVIAKVLDQQVRHFHHRTLSDRYHYILLDAVYLKAKAPLSVRKRCVLVAYGITPQGQRELIDFQLTSSESQVAWECFLAHLVRRGLMGAQLRLAIIDGNKGLANALDFAWPGLPRQRCWAHKLRNVANRLPRRLQKLCTAQAYDIYAADSYTKALKAFKLWKKTWQPLAPAAVRCLEDDLDHLLVFYRCPKPLWKKLRTTNAIERVFREVRRRTRPMSCFQNNDSVERIIYAIFYRQNNLWKDKPLKITQNS